MIQPSSLAVSTHASDSVHVEMSLPSSPSHASSHATSHHASHALSSLSSPASSSSSHTHDRRRSITASLAMVIKPFILYPAIFVCSYLSVMLFYISAFTLKLDSPASIASNERHAHTHTQARVHKHMHAYTCHMCVCVSE